MSFDSASTFEAGVDGVAGARVRGLEIEVGVDRQAEAGAPDRDARRGMAAQRNPARPQSPAAPDDPS